MMRRNIELYGPLRDLDNTGRVALELADDATSDDVRRAFVQWHSASRGSGGAAKLAQLLERTVLAAGDEILLDTDTIGTASELALVPPVCGG